MPYKVRKIGGKWRVVKPSGAIAQGKAGSSVDGGGHNSASMARRQIAAIMRRERGGK